MFSQSDTLVEVYKNIILFDSDHANIREDQISKFDTLLLMIRKINPESIVVVAHTDQKGNNQYNLKLSRNRADSVAVYLQNNGVSTELIEKQFRGEEQLLSEEFSSDDLQLNRRAEVLLYKKVPLIKLNGQILDDSTQSGIQASIRMHSKLWTNKVDTDSSGYFSLQAPKGQLIGLDVTAKGYFFETEMIKADAKANGKLKLALSRLELGKKFEVDNMYFVGGMDLLLRKSFKTLVRLKALMLSNPEICIAINGHINLPNKPRTEFNTRNHDLSIARARRIYNYLIDSGVTTDRMRFKGFGNWEMVKPRARNEFEMAMNRRVELEIIDCQKSTSAINDTLSEFSFFYIFRPQSYELK